MSVSTLDAIMPLVLYQAKSAYPEVNKITFIYKVSFDYVIYRPTCFYFESGTRIFCGSRMNYDADYVSMRLSSIKQINVFVIFYFIFLRTAHNFRGFNIE